MAADRVVLKVLLRPFVRWRYSYYTHRPFQVSSGKLYWLSHKPQQKGLKVSNTPLDDINPETRLSNFCLFKGLKKKKRKGGISSPEVSYSFSISSQRVTGVASSASHLESDQTAASATCSTSWQSLDNPVLFHLFVCSSVHPFAPVPSIHPHIEIRLPVLWLYFISFFPLFCLGCDDIFGRIPR